ncbi:hypothetical protein ACHAXR_001057, partial [Thalassiosira sp. AJA248-18]
MDGPAGKIQPWRIESGSSAGRHHQGQSRRLSVTAERTPNHASTITPPDRKGRRSGQRSGLRSDQRTRPSKSIRVAEHLVLGNDPERGPRRKEYSHHSSRRSDKNRRNVRRHTRLNRHTILSYIFVVACLVVAPVNYFFVKTNWSRRKTAALQSKAVPDENAENFIRTGQLPGAKKRLTSSVNRPKRESRANTISSKGTSREMEGNRFMHEKKSKYKLEEWPPLSSLLDRSGGIAADANISGLLDFSIIGFPKTGTTSILRHLSDLTHSLSTEHCDLVVNDTAKLVRDIYDDHAQRLKQSRDGAILMENQLRGIKCPQDISSDWSMHNYAKYLPHTKLIVGIRHPIFWFQSLYNFRVSNVPWKSMLHTSKLTKG